MDALKLISSYSKDVCNSVGTYDVCVTLVDKPHRLIISDINGMGYEIVAVSDTELKVYRNDKQTGLPVESSCEVNNEHEFEALLAKIKAYIEEGLEDPEEPL